MGRLPYAFLLVLLIVRVVTFESGIPEGKKLRLEGRVIREPVVYEYSRQIYIKGLRAYIPKFPEVGYGDVVVLEGVAQDGVFEEAELIEIKDRGEGLYRIRERLVENFGQFLPSPHSAIVAGVVLGSRSLLNSDLWSKLKASSTAHIVVASGTNITFTIAFLMSILLTVLSRKKAIMFSLIGVWVYVILSGFDAPIVRAAIMGSIAFTAQALGRMNASLRALLFTGGLMLFVNPLWLSDYGFLLSFFATLAIIVFDRLIYKKIAFVPRFVRQDFSTTIAANIGVAPILLLSFGYVNPLAPFVNVLVLWTVPPIMIIGAIGGTIGLFSDLLGRLVVLFVYPLTSWFAFVINLISN